MQQQADRRPRRCSPPTARCIGADPDEFDSARDDDGPRHAHRVDRRRQRRRDAEIFGRHVGHDLRHRPARADHRLQGSRQPRRLHLRPRGGDRPGRRRRRRRHQLLDRWRRRTCSSADTIAFLFAADAGVFVATSPPATAGRAPPPSAVPPTSRGSRRSAPTRRTASSRARSSSATAGVHRRRLAPRQ